MKVYLDGCSLTYGQGLDRDKSLGHLLQVISGHSVVDLSAPSKSNFAIVRDAWNNRLEHDVYMLGFTYSDRFTVNFRDLEVHLHPATPFKRVDYQHFNDAIIENSISSIHKGIYTLYEAAFYRNQSDCLVDMIITKLTALNKIVIPFSWEKRKIDWDIFYPVYDQEYKISKTDKHLNEKGTRHLYDTLQMILTKKINEK